MTWKKTACILCSENCGLEIKVDAGRFTHIRGDKANPESRGYLCQKATRLDHYQNHEDRLSSPLEKQADGSWKPISWDIAIAAIAQKLLAIKAEYGGKTIAYYGGGGQGNHLGGVYGASLREALETPFLYTALAQEKTGDFWVNGKLFGKQTCHITSDVENASYVVFLGTNPWQSHGFARARVVLKEIQRDPSRTMVVIDPRRTKTAQMADIHLQLRPGTDAYLLAALLAILVETGSIDSGFLDAHCTGAEPVLSSLRQIPISEFIAIAGLQEEEVRKVAQGLAAAPAACIRADLGIQQSQNSSLNSYLEKLLFLLTGNLGKEGSNNFHSFLMPLIGHSPDADKDPRIARTAIHNMAPISKLYPPNILPDEILGDHPEHIRAVFVDSANPVVSGADSGAYKKAFSALDLLVVVDVCLSETAEMADYVLPACSQFEKTEATFFSLKFPGNAFHLRTPIAPKHPGTLPEPEMYRRLCVALGALPERFPLLEATAKYGGRKAFGIALKLLFSRKPKLASMAPLVLYSTLGKTLGKDMESAAVLWAAAHHYAKRHHSAVRRAGITGKDLGEALFDKLLASRSGLIFSRHRYDDTLSFIRHSDKKIHLAIPELIAALEALPTTAQAPSSEFPFLLMAGERRSYNANTIYRSPDWRKDDPDGRMQMAKSDAETLGVASGDTVTVRSEVGELSVVVQCSDAILPGVVSIPHGYGLAYPVDGKRVVFGPQVNELTSSGHCDTITKTPFHKGVPVAILGKTP